MTAIERLFADKPEKFGPEKYAPPDRRPSENLSDIERMAFLHQQRSEAVPVGDPVIENMNLLIQRVSSASMEEIDHVTFELQSVRDMLRSDGERVSREVAGYANLCQASMTAMKVITDSLKRWKSEPDKSGPRVVN
jgi:hypothetical protein